MAFEQRGVNMLWWPVLDDKIAETASQRAQGLCPPNYNIARSGGGGNVNRLRKFGLKLLARTSMD